MNKSIRRYTLQIFLERATSVHGDKYDYTDVKDNGLMTVMMKIPVKCKRCNYKWNPTINDHINGKCGCPSCARNVRWTYERFIIKAREIHGDKYNYEDIKPEHVLNCDSKIPVRCNECYYNWTPTIDNHIYSCSGCPDCGGKVQWTYNRFISKSNEIHGGRYNYDLIKEDDIKCALTRINIKCNRCITTWNTTVVSHINLKSGCPKCSKSKGEIQCCVTLDKLGIPYQCQYNLPSLPRKRYDIFFIVANNSYLLEFDGKQHFEFDPHFHKSIRDFHERQQIDIDKTYHAKVSGFKLIRIDYTQLNYIDYHISQAINILNSTANVYYSDMRKYLYIIDGLSTKIIQ